MIHIHVICEYTYFPDVSSMTSHSFVHLLYTKSVLFFFRDLVHFFLNTVQTRIRYMIFNFMDLFHRPILN
jgi:hypothetical protein